MQKVSKLEVRKCIKKINNVDKYSNGEVAFADLIIDGNSLYQMFCGCGYDVISCLGWSFPHIQNDEISKLLLRNKPDFKGKRYAIYVCPLCGDLGCGAVSMKIERDSNIIIWKDFGFEDNLGIIKLQKENLKGIGPFYFNFDQYQSAIKSSFGVGDTFTE